MTFLQGLLQILLCNEDWFLHPIGPDQWSSPNQLQSGPVSGLLRSLGLGL